VFAAPAAPELTNEFLDALAACFQFGQTIPIFFTNSGTGLLTRINLSLAKVKNCLLINTEALRHGWLGHIHDRYDALIVAQWVKSSPLYSLNELNPWIASARVITRVNEEPTVAKPLRFRYKEFSIDGFHIYRTANCSPSLFKYDEIETLRDRFSVTHDVKPWRSANDFIAAELFLKENPLATAQPEFSVGSYWERIIREPAIPFSSTDRQVKLSHVYQTLSEYFADLTDHSIDA